GKLLWKVIDPDYHLHSVYGAASSPIIVDDKVIVLRDKEIPMSRPEEKIGPSTLVAYDKWSGSVMWQVRDEEAMNSYATPLVRKCESGTEIIVVTCRKVVAYDAHSGKVRWRQAHPMHQVASAPVMLDNMIWMSAGAQHGGDRDARTMASRLPDEGTGETGSLVWETKRDVSTCVSPVVYDGKLYTLTYYGKMVCYEATTGNVIWRKRIGRGQWFAALLIGSDSLFASNDRGHTVVLDVKGSGDVVSENDLEESIYAAPAVAGDCLLIITVNTLYCIEPNSN
ncbi:MAG: PQQ-binding-like beta-propeller repeat protein, partial [Planctomycetota bacterium]